MGNYSDYKPTKITAPHCWYVSDCLVSEWIYWEFAIHSSWFWRRLSYGPPSKTRESRQFNRWWVNFKYQSCHWYLQVLLWQLKWVHGNNLHTLVFGPPMTVAIYPLTTGVAPICSPSTIWEWFYHQVITKYEVAIVGSRISFLGVDHPPSL